MIPLAAREILSRLDILEKDVSRLNESFRDLRSEIGSLRKEMNERFDRMYTQMDSLIKWTVGTIGLLGTLITILLIVSQFLK
jgi:predicted nuclease with TOPRIM domain